MNERGRDVLLEASLNGLPQLRRVPAAGGLSAVGLLLQAAGCGHLLLPAEWFLVPENVAEHARCWRRAGRKYGIDADEWNSLNRENDELGWDFLTMAWHHTRGKDATLSVDNAAAVSSCGQFVIHASKSIELPLPSAPAHEWTSAATMQTGSLKRCYGCDGLIYLHLDADGRWRPYESWKAGVVEAGHWQLHRCSERRQA